ncbi:MAG: hypothetical protein ACI9U2_000975, partial [Bradymonadia bacterium]
MLLALWAALLLAPPGPVIDRPINPPDHPSYRIGRPTHRIDHPTHRIDGIQHVQQGRAPFCAAAAGLMGASRLGPVPDLRAFVRTLPVSAEGIPWLELSDALRGLGIDAHVIESNMGELRRLIRRDIPVIIAVSHGARRHAVLVAGIDAAGFWVRDPAVPTPVHWTPEALQARWSANQAVVLPALGTAHPRKAVWQAMDRRYRALEWALRAEKHPTPSADMLALYDQAVAA